MAWRSVIVAAMAVTMAACSKHDGTTKTSNSSPALDARLSGTSSPSSDFLRQCLIAGNVPVDHTSVADYLSVMSLKPSAKATWEDVAGGSHILRIINDDSMTHETTNIALLFDPLSKPVKDPSCGPAFAVVSRLTVGKEDIEQSQIYEMMLRLVDQDKLVALIQSRSAAPVSEPASSVTEAHVGSALGTTQPSGQLASEPSSNTPDDVRPKNSAELRYSAKYNKCMDDAGGVTSSMLDCIATESESQDKQLNATYKGIMNSADSAKQTSLRDDERLWLKTRKKKCDDASAADGDGSMATITLNDCILSTTVERTITLEKMR